MQPLDGLLVVGLEVAVSAPHCTRQLADLGARVIKLEPPAGDFARYYDNSVGDVSCYFAWANRGKESVALDLKSPADRELAERIVARADVMVQNLAPGAAQRLDLDARSLVSRHPRLVAVDISGYGSGGDRETSRAYDLLVQAEAGSCAVTGTADAPAKPGIPVADIGTGMTAANAILAALLARSQSGQVTLHPTYPFFFRLARAACRTSVASFRPASRNSVSMDPNSSASGTSTARSTICRMACSIWGRSCCMMASMRSSRLGSGAEAFLGLVVDMRTSTGDGRDGFAQTPAR